MRRRQPRPGKVYVNICADRPNPSLVNVLTHGSALVNGSVTLQFPGSSCGNAGHPFISPLAVVCVCAQVLACISSRSVCTPYSANSLRALREKLSQCNCILRKPKSIPTMCIISINHGAFSPLCTETYSALYILLIMLDMQIVALVIRLKGGVFNVNLILFPVFLPGLISLY